MSFTNSNKKILTYTITDTLLGRGSYSKVYLGYTITNQKCAIKIISSIGLNTSIKDKLLDEAKILKKLNHINIIKLYDIYEDIGDIYIIMEFCDNTMLNLMDNNIDELKIKYYIKQIVDGLFYLQKCNIVHRDIKPANILLKNDLIKIADFGFAKMLNDNTSMMDTICGSPLYMAPEILFKTKYTSKSDLWSLGVIIYQMVYKKHPYNNSKSIIELIKKMEGDTIFFDKNNVSIQCIELLKELLNLSPSNRMSLNELRNHEWFIDVNLQSNNVLNDNDILNDMKYNDVLNDNDIFNIDDITLNVKSENLSFNENVDSNIIIDNYLEEINIITKPINIIPKKIELKSNINKGVISGNYINSSFEKNISSSILFNILKYKKN
jgi:serine/threonine protein kinase